MEPSSSSTSPSFSSSTKKPYIIQVEEELAKATYNFKQLSLRAKQKKNITENPPPANSEGKNSTEKPVSSLSVAMMLIEIVKWSSTLKLLKDDYEPVQILPHLFLGSIGCASNFESLNKHKITHILCCASGIEKFFPENFEYYQIDLLDDGKTNIRQYFDNCNDFIKKGIKRGGNVLVHCHAGVSRSSSMLIAYLVGVEKMTVDKALELLKTKRNKVMPKEGFIQQLKKYQEELGIK